MPKTYLSHSERANEILSRMTLIEKAYQVSAIGPSTLLTEGRLNTAALAHGIGHVSGPASAVQSPQQIAELANGIQRFLVEGTRLGIPAMLHAEALNGLVAPGFTSFPTAIGLAATWDPERVERMADIIRRQMRSVGLHHALSPVFDVARDARWGRVHETYGEDVYLASAMGVAFVQGLQTDDLSHGVIATGKHFLGYAMTEAGQNMAATHFGSRELYDVYATPFEAAIHLAGLRSIMNSYSEVDGVPVGADRAILTEMLRERMGFTGSVVSDYMAIEWLHSRQFVADSYEDAGILALSAGLDIELPGIVAYGAQLAAAVEGGRLQERVLDDAVRRALIDKLAVGLFERPFVNTDQIILSELAGEGRDLSRELADESITMLTNDGILPLSRNAKIAVIGPNATAAMVNFAAYTYPAHLDMLKGLATGESRMAGVQLASDSEQTDQSRARFAALAAVDTEVIARHAYGTIGLDEAIRRAGGDVISTEGVPIHPDDVADIASAVEMATSADVVVLALGGRAGWFGTRITEGEGTDSASIELAPHQVDLVKVLAATGTPVVGVFYQGRPYAFEEVKDLFAAVLVAYFPGPEGPLAVAATLFGDIEPTGRLPYSIPRSTGQVPIYVGQHHGSGYRRGSADMLRRYIDEELSPAFPFGHGLGYTSFTYGDLRLSASSAPAAGGEVTLSVDVANVGERDGVEVVQFYSADAAPIVTRPALQLVGFVRVKIRAGATVNVQCSLSMSQLGYSGPDGKFVLDPGPIEFSAGSSSADLRSSATLDVTGPVAELEGRRSYLSVSRFSESSH